LMEIHRLKSVLLETVLAFATSAEMRGGIRGGKN
jgi:hypothetical protein